MWLMPNAASLRELQCVEPSTGLRCKVQLIMRASKRSVPGATALADDVPKTGDTSSQKTLPPEFGGIDAAGLAAINHGQRLPSSQSQDNTRSANLVGTDALLQLIRFPHDAPGGFNLKGAA
jgi:hypothetical protein